ncbi:major facilitator superfamily domain-containing protein [Aspergillus coremiiformis]|uniref:Major facilitator superfamily domain-containing protein n=1 Tax=Aspergillus coremiiformis TaxID=138285 RepID=A0A5N6Z814_9EURO|nr:major facilitator superfamily domain-containing protein [Aspergillus coremiiformis]
MEVSKSDHEPLQGIQHGQSYDSIPSSEISEIPNGGGKAWLQVLGAFLVYFNSWALADSYGAYQTFYQGGSLFSASASSISWIGSTQASVIQILGLITGPLYDAGYFQSLIYTGSFMILFGQMILSLCHTYYQIFLVQAVCQGIGAGLLAVPGITNLSAYFDTRIELATGIATAGGGVGAIIYPIMFQQIATQVGFGWCVRAIGLLMLVTLSLQVAVLRDRPRPMRPSKGMNVDWTALKEPAYVMFLLGGIIASISVNIPNYYIQIYAIRNHITTGGVGFYLLSILNAGSVCGRLGLNALAEKLGPFNVFAFSITLCGVLCFALMNVESLSGLIVILILYGFVAGALISLPPPCFVKLSPDRGVVGTRMGMGYAASVVGTLVGPPMAGAIQDRMGFNAMWVFSGAVSIAAGVVLLLSRGFHGGWAVWAKV